MRSIYGALPLASTKEYTLVVEYSLSIGQGLSENVLNGEYLLQADCGKELADYATSPIPALRIYSLSTIRQLSQHSQPWREAFMTGGKAGIPAEGLLPALIPQIKSQNESISVLSLQIIRALSIQSPNTTENDQKNLSAYGTHLISALVTLIKPGGGSPAQKRSAYVALSTLLESENMQKTFGKEKGVDTLVELILDPSGSPDVVQSAASLLGNLLDSNEEILDQFIEQGYLERIVTTGGAVQDPQVAAGILGVCANILLCSDELREQFFASSKCLDQLSSSLKHSSEPIQRSALRCSINLTLAYQHIPLLLQGNQQLLPSLKSTLAQKPSLQGLALSLIVNLSAHEECQGQLTSVMGPLSWINGYLKDSDESKGLAGLKILTNYAVRGRNRKWLHEEGKATLKILQDCKNLPGLKEQADSALCNLSFPYEDHYDSEAVEKAKELPEYVEDEDFSDEEDVEETKEVETSRSTTAPVIVQPISPSVERKKAAEAQRIENETKKAEAEARKAEAEAKSRAIELEREKKELEERAEALSRQKEEAILKQQQEEAQEQAKQAEEASAREAQRLADEAEVAKLKAESEAIRLRMEKEAAAKQALLDKANALKTDDKQQTEAEESSLAAARSDLEAGRSELEGLEKKLVIVSSKREARQRKVTKVLDRTQKSQSKVNRKMKESVAEADSSPEVLKQRELASQAQESQSKLRRAEKREKQLDVERGALQVSLKEREAAFESLLCSTDESQKMTLRQVK